MTRIRRPGGDEELVPAGGDFGVADAVPLLDDEQLERPLPVSRTTSATQAKSGAHGVLTVGTIYILGTRDLKRELLREVLIQRLGVECTVIEGIGAVQTAGDTRADGRVLFLIDCTDDRTDLLLSEVVSHKQAEGSADVVGLYEIDQPGSIEHDAVQKGVRGFFYKSDPIDLLCRGIVALLSGEVWISREILAEMAFRSSVSHPHQEMEKAGLTRREAETLALVGTGLTNDEIADKLSISTHTVKTHLYRVFRKIQVNNRFQAALWAAKHL